MRGNLKKIFDSYFSYLFGLTGFLSFLMPDIKIELGLIISLSFSTIYFLVLSLWLKRQNNSVISQRNNKDVLLKIKENEIDLHKEFIYKRKLFRTHDLPKAISITTEEYGYLKDKYRGNRFRPIIEDVKLSRNALEEIINKEMRDFDEQLYYLPSNKDN